jgi:hypothetical protein
MTSLAINNLPAKRILTIRIFNLSSKNANVKKKKLPNAIFFETFLKTKDLIFLPYTVDK